MKSSLLFCLFLVLGLGPLSAQPSKTTQTRDLTGFTNVSLKIPALVYVTQDNRYSVEVTANQEVLEHITTEIKGRTLLIYFEPSDYGKNRSDIHINITLPKANELSVYGSGSIEAQNNLMSDNLTLEVNGSGKIHVKDFKAEKMAALVYGSGEVVQGAGVANGMEQEINGSGSITAADLSGKSLVVALNGSGNVKIGKLKSEKLEASSAGSGYVQITTGSVLMAELDNAGSGRIAAQDLFGNTVEASIAGSGSISIGVVQDLNASITGSGSVNYKGMPSNIVKTINGSGNVRQIQ